MYQVDGKPMETIHLYVVREEVARHSLLPVFLSVFAFSILVALSVLIPYQQPEIRTAIRVPAVLLPLKTFSARAAIIPSGIKTYPATKARGILTLTNGSVLTEELPKGMIFTGKDGVEVITDTAVFVPAGSASGLGFANVSAHALVMSGLQGNIQALDINQVYGTSLFIRNLQAFAGGQNAYTVTFVTQQDRQTALDHARTVLVQSVQIKTLLDYPCQEIFAGNQTLHVTWTCQFVTYQIPQLPQVKVLHARVEGKNVLVDVMYVERPRLLTAKYVEESEKVGYT